MLDLDQILAICFTLGLTISYIPQYYILYKTKTADGFSMWFIFLGYCASFLSWIGSSIYFVPSWKVCTSSIECLQLSSSLLLIIYQWFLFLLFYVMVIYYYQDPDELVTDSERKWLFETDAAISFLLPPKKPTYELFKHMSKKSVLFYFGLAHALGLLVIAVNLWLLSQGHWQGEIAANTLIWSEVISVLTTIFFCLHYLPQLYTTVRNKGTGSFSLITLAMLCPGTFAWTYFLASHKVESMSNIPQEPSPAVWIPYLFVGTLQLTLLLVGIHYECQKKRRAAGYNISV